MQKPNRKVRTPQRAELMVGKINLAKSIRCTFSVKNDYRIYVPVAAFQAIESGLLTWQEFNAMCLEVFLERRQHSMDKAEARFEAAKRKKKGKK